MAGITVGQATAADWDDLVSLWAADREGAAVAEVRAGAEEARRAWDFLRGDGFWVLLARVGGEPAGFAHVCRIPKADSRRGYLYVDELFVHPAHRRKGVAMALLNHAADLSRELGLAGVRLLVRSENAAARALYRKAGFQEHSTILCQRETGQAP
ncbi:MAG: GNAT family N-acetyltransferase [Chloroflexi bacterium]|nr:GNAT family N-acetyltransferase [Chloroflexota bacterium]